METASLIETSDIIAAMRILLDLPKDNDQLDAVNAAIQTSRKCLNVHPGEYPVIFDLVRISKYQIKECRILGVQLRSLLCLERLNRYTYRNIEELLPGYPHQYWFYLGRILPSTIEDDIVSFRKGREIPSERVKLILTELERLLVNYEVEMRARIEDYDISHCAAVIFMIQGIIDDVEAEPRERSTAP